MFGVCCGGCQLALLLSGRRLHTLRILRLVGLERNISPDLISKYRSNLLQRKSLCIWVEKPRDDGKEICGDDEGQVEFPANVGKSSWRRLEPHDIHQGDGSHANGHALVAEMAWKQLREVHILRSVQQKFGKCLSMSVPLTQFEKDSG